MELAGVAPLAGSFASGRPKGVFSDPLPTATGVNFTLICAGCSIAALDIADSTKLDDDIVSVELAYSQYKFVKHGRGKREVLQEVTLAQWHPDEFKKLTNKNKKVG